MKTLAVLMPTYNAGEYLNESISSILNQTYKDFDFFIYDDCSTDNTSEIISGFPDKRIKYRRNRENMGIAKTLNQGLDELLPEYDFIARMDADDWCYPHRLERQLISFEQDENLIMCGTQGYWLQNLNDQPGYAWQYPHSNRALNISLLFSASFGHSSVIFKSNFMREHNFRYDENFIIGEDWELWSRMLLKGKAINLPDFLMKYRILPNSNHRKNDNKNLLLNEKITIIKKNWSGYGFTLEKCDLAKFYFNKEKLNRTEFIRLLKMYIQLFNWLDTNEIILLEDWEKNYFRYRFGRNILNFWKNSGINRINIRMWFIIFSSVTFNNKIDLIKSLIR